MSLVFFSPELPTIVSLDPLTSAKALKAGQVNGIKAEQEMKINTLVHMKVSAGFFTVPVPPCKASNNIKVSHTSK